jgi:hypothetical protein
MESHLRTSPGLNSGFDLESAIQQWRQRLAGEPSVSSDGLAELEEHLRTSIDDLRSKGLSAQEAYQIAAQRLGEPKAIGTEFQQINPAEVWGRRVLWMAIGCLVTQFWSSISSSATQLTFAVLGPNPWDANQGQSLNTARNLIMIGTHLVFWILLMGGAVLLAKGKGSPQLEKASRWLSDRTRFVLVVTLLGGVLQLTSLWTSRYGMPNRHSYGFESLENQLLMFASGAIYKIPLALLIAWLMPRHLLRQRELVSAD